MSTSDTTGKAKGYLRKLSYGARASSGFESLGAESTSSESLGPDRAKEARARAVEIIKNESKADLTVAEKEELDQLFLKDGEQAMARLRDDGDQATLNDDHIDALEAIVITDGSRPALRLSEQDKIDLDDEILDQWKGVASLYSDQITQVASAVGRIDKNGQHQGTGFVIKRGLILTNRHVLQGIAEQNASGQWSFEGEPTIAFNANPGVNRDREYKIKKHVVLAGDTAIDPFSLDFNKMDFAVLECDVSDGDLFPDPLPLESATNKVVPERPVYTVGYPGKPRLGTYKFDVLLKLFGNKFSIKRFAPGEIDSEFGISGDQVKTVFTHDATTLGGNSGSCVVDFGNDGLLVVGLHFAGMPKTQNYAHSIAKLKNLLNSLNLTWDIAI